jgi:hypothetical protein
MNKLVQVSIQLYKAIESQNEFYVQQKTITYPFNKLSNYYVTCYDKVALAT